LRLSRQWHPRLLPSGTWKRTSHFPFPYHFIYTG
jgi:hypothetical protein